MKAHFVILSVALVLFAGNRTPASAATLPADYTKPGAVDCDKFEKPQVTVNGDEVTYTFPYDAKYNNACGMANVAALFWASGYRKIRNGNQTQDAQSLRDYFDWICQDYAAMVHGGNNPYPSMGLGQQKAYMDKYLGDPNTNQNPNPNPRRVVTVGVNAGRGENNPLTPAQVEELKQKLFSCSLVCVILQKPKPGGGFVNHEVQIVGWTTDGRFRVFDPDTDRAVWNGQTFTFEDAEYWGSSVADNAWRLTPDGSSEAWNAVGYKVFSVPEPASLLLLTLGGLASLRRKDP